MTFRELTMAAQMWTPWWYVWMVGKPVLFFSNTKCSHHFNETNLETLTMLEKALKMLLNISGDVMPTARQAWGQTSFLK